MVSNELAETSERLHRPADAHERRVVRMREKLIDWGFRALIVQMCIRDRSSGAGEAQAESKRKRDNTRANHFCFMLVNRLSCLNNFSIERRVEEGCRSVSKIL